MRKRREDTAIAPLRGKRKNAERERRERGTGRPRSWPTKNGTIGQVDIRSTPPPALAITQHIPTEVEQRRLVIAYSTQADFSGCIRKSQKGQKEAQVERSLQEIRQCRCFAVPAVTTTRGGDAQNFSTTDPRAPRVSSAPLEHSNVRESSAVPHKSGIQPARVSAGRWRARL